MFFNYSKYLITSAKKENIFFINVFFLRNLFSYIEIKTNNYLYAQTITFSFRRYHHFAFSPAQL